MVSHKRSRATSLLALLSVVFLLATACSDDSGDEASTETTAASDDSGTTTAAGDQEPPSESAAASLRSDLVGLLEEQVYLTGFTVESGVGAAGADAPLSTAYDAEAGHNVDDLGNILGGAYGVAAGNDIIAAFNDHRDAVVAYGLTNGPADAVATTRDAIVDALSSADAEAAFTDVGNRLEDSDTALLTAVDAMVAQQPAAADLHTAAAEMPDVALDLAESVAGAIEVEGEVDSPESALRADLTGLLQESALLTGLGLAETVAADGDATAPLPAGTFSAVEDNTQALAEAVEPDDSAAASQFAGLWGGHIDAFTDYTTAQLGDDAAGIQDAEDRLVQFRDDIGELLAEDYPGFTKELVAEELVDHTDSVLAFADALVAEQADPSFADTDGVPESPSLLRTAALNMRLAARSLTGGLTAPASTGDEDAATTTTEA